MLMAIGEDRATRECGPSALMVLTAGGPLQIRPGPCFSAGSSNAQNSDLLGRSPRAGTKTPPADRSPSAKVKKSPLFAVLVPIPGTSGERR